MCEIRFHHIGIACKDIKKTAQQYIELGYNPENTIEDPLQNVYVCFLHKDSMPSIELLAPLNDKSPILKILQKNGTSPYHICYAVNDLHDGIKHFKQKKYILVSKPKYSSAIEGAEVAFLYNPDMGLIELTDKK